MSFEVARIPSISVEHQLVNGTAGAGKYVASPSKALAGATW